jgi:hypothetical protein
MYIDLLGHMSRKKAINGGIALSSALSLVYISMIVRIWHIGMAEKFWMQNNIIIQLFFIAQI